MASISSVRGPEAIKALERIGFVQVRQKGSHVTLKKEGHASIVTVPVHGNKPLKKGTAEAVAKQAGLSVQQFLDLL